MLSAISRQNGVITVSTIIIKRDKRTVNHPPGPQGNWLTGTVKAFQEDTLQTMIELNQMYGDAIRFRFFLNYYGYIFTHPTHNKHILQDNNKNYTKTPNPTLELIQQIVGNGLLTNDGASWRRQRRLAQPAFHRRRIAGFAQIMTEATRAMITEWQPGDTVDIDQKMMQLTLEIVGKALFSIDLTREAKKVGEAFTKVNHTFMKLNTKPFSTMSVKIPWLTTTRTLRNNTAIMDEVVHKIINERRANPNYATDDLLNMLMEAKDEETGEGMSDQQLRDEVLTLLLAGHETTANTLSWAFYLLSQHPTVLARVEAEVDEVLNGRLPTITDIPQLRYTNMVIEETLRLYPVAYAIGRSSQEADTIDGYDIPANAIVTLSPYLTHRHPDFWQTPELFDPERFTPERKAERPRYAYLPFGGGPRQCIGNTFALAETAIVLASIVQRYRLSLKPGHPVTIEPLITLRPKHGLPMVVSART